MNKTAKSGFSKVGGSIDPKAKKAVLTFTRPLTNLENEDANLETGKSYGMVMTWARQNGKGNDEGNKVRGEKTGGTNHGKIFSLKVLPAPAANIKMGSIALKFGAASLLAAAANYF